MYVSLKGVLLSEHMQQCHFLSSKMDQLLSGAASGHVLISFRHCRVEWSGEVQGVRRWLRDEKCFGSGRGVLNRGGTRNILDQVEAGLMRFH